MGEAAFVHELGLRGHAADLKRRLEAMEARIDEARDRRRDLLADKESKRRDRERAHREHVGTQRIERAELAAARWDKLQSRLEAVERRRAARMDARGDAARRRDQRRGGGAAAAAAARPKAGRPVGTRRRRRGRRRRGRRGRGGQGRAARDEPPPPPPVVVAPKPAAAAPPPQQPPKRRRRRRTRSGGAEMAKLLGGPGRGGRPPRACWRTPGRRPRPRRRRHTGGAREARAAAANAANGGKPLDAVQSRVAGAANDAAAWALAKYVREDASPASKECCLPACVCLAAALGDDPSRLSALDDAVLDLARDVCLKSACKQHNDVATAALACVAAACTAGPAPGLSRGARAAPSSRPWSRRASRRTALS